MNGNLSWRSIFVTPFAMPMRLTALKKRAYLKGIELVYRLRQKMGGYYIGANAEFAQWPFFPHGYSGVYISGGARVGRRYVVFRQVTIGSDSLAGSGKTGSPTIGDDCYIGAGAKNIGSVKICNGCRIGANAVVYKDVPPNSTVVGAWGGRERGIEHSQPMGNRFYNNGPSGWQYWDGEKFVSCIANNDTAVIKR